MRLAHITEGHWEIAPGKYPGSMYKGSKKPKRHSFLLHPDDRERFAKNMKIAEDLDDIKYYKILDDAKYIDAPTPMLGDSWKSIRLQPPPTNSSSRTKEELDFIIHVTNELDDDDIDEIKSQDIDNLEQTFIDLLEDHGVRVSEQLHSQVKQLAGELTTVGIFFKRQFNRARPYQLLRELNIDNNVMAGKTARSPSYPSTHALIGYYLSHWLADKFPNLKGELYKLGYDLGYNRVRAGFHYLSDFIAGVDLAKRLL